MTNEFIKLTKPRLTLMAAAMVLTSFYLASTPRMDWMLLFKALLGASLVGGGMNTLNQFLERREDSRMKRTEGRPLVRKTLSEAQAFFFGVFLSLGGVLYLTFFVNALAGLTACLTFAVYLFLYTPLKKKTPFNTLVGAISGAMPVWIGWTAAGGRVSDPDPWVLFAILFIWQLPHFLAIAWVYREDYKQGGFRMMTLSDDFGRSTSRQILFCCAVLFFSSILPTFFGITGLLYLTASLITGLFFLGLAYGMTLRPMAYAKQFIPASIFYLSVLNLFMLFDKI